MTQWEDTLDVDIRTRRPSKETKPFEKTNERFRDDSQLEYTKSLFRDLVKQPVYVKLKSLAYALSQTHAQPREFNQLIAWGFSMAARSFLDMYFDHIEQLGKEVPAEEQPVVNRTRVSFFAENHPE